MKVALIFPGWGSPKKLYDKINLPDYEKVYIGIDKLEYAAKILKSKRVEEAIIIAWSMGTIAALREIVAFDKIKIKTVLISPVLNFLEAQSLESLNSMIKDIKKNKSTVLKYFNKQNFYNREKFEEYMENFKTELDLNEEDTLIEGLNYLIERRVEIKEKNGFIEPLIVIGKNDNIIKPVESIKCAAIFEKSKIVEIDECGHNIIYEKPEILNDIIRSYLDDFKGESNT